MSDYDSPGFQDQLPGFPPRSAHDYGSAPGSESPGDAGPAGPVVATVGVAPGNLPDSPLAMPREQVSVTAPDTSGFSDDQSVHESVFLSGGRVGNSPDQTGAGAGRYSHVRHPDAAAGQK